jgi:hypothetical protein
MGKRKTNTRPTWFRFNVDEFTITTNEMSTFDYGAYVRHGYGGMEKWRTAPGQ